MNVSTPDLFTLPEKLDLTEQERSALVDLLSSDAWTIMNRVWDWQQGVLTLAMCHANEKLEFHQGRLNGFATARAIIERLGQINKEGKKTDKHDLPKREAEFFARWSSGKSTSSYS